MLAQPTLPQRPGPVADDDVGVARQQRDGPGLVRGDIDDDEFEPGRLRETLGLDRFQNPAQRAEFQGRDAECADRIGRA